MFSIDRASPIALSRQIEDQLRHLVESRALAGGTKLMSIRQLAAQLAVSTNTVVLAYDRLVAAGIIDSHGTAGFYVRARSDEPRCAPDEAALEAGEEQEPVWLVQQANDQRAGAPRHFARCRVVQTQLSSPSQSSLRSTEFAGWIVDTACL